MPLLFSPQSHYYNTSLRDQYLRQLAQDAAHDRYLAGPDDYCYPRRPSFAALQQVHAQQRESAARQRVALERYRQQQLELERQRQEQRYLAERERRRYLDAIRRAHQSYGWGSQQSDSEDQDDEMFENVHFRSDSPAPVHIIPTSPNPQRPQPSFEEKQKAASLIQSSYRARLARRNALNTLSSIRSSFNNHTSSFVFPSKLSFDSTPDSSSFKLSYNPINVPIHGFEDDLMKLLAKLDSVESNGDLVVRKERKSLARDIEAELERLDRKKEEAWEAYRVESQLQIQQQENGSLDSDTADPMDTSAGQEIEMEQVDNSAPRTNEEVIVMRDDKDAKVSNGEERSEEKEEFALVDSEQAAPGRTSTIEEPLHTEGEGGMDVCVFAPLRSSRSQSPVSEPAEPQQLEEDFILVDSYPSQVLGKVLENIESKDE